MSVNLMCLDKMCPLYTRCYRAQAVPTANQKYFNSPYVWKFGCNDYIPIGGSKWPENQGLKQDVVDVGRKQSSLPSSRTHSEATRSDGDQFMTVYAPLIADEVYTSVQYVDNSCPEPSSTSCDVGE